MNENKELRTLLDRFYNGETTSEEEQQIHQSLHSDDLSPEMSADRLLFDELYNLSTDAPEGLENRLKRQIDGWNTVERSASRSSRTVFLRWTVGIAASLLLLFSLGMYLQNRSGQEQMAHQNNISTPMQDTYSKPEDAYAETQRALVKFSKSLNKGLKTMEKVTE